MIPNFLTVYDFIYVLNRPSVGVWSTWSSLSEEPALSPELKFNEIMIETGETYRQAFFLEKFIKIDRMCLFVGPPGTGKTFFLKNFLQKLPKENYFINQMKFTVTSNSAKVQDKILDKAIK